MQLLDLNPRFGSSGGFGVRNKDGSPAPERKGIALICDCPKCGMDHPLCVPFFNPLDGGPSIYPNKHSWKRVGDNFEELTLSPSILRKDCGWHGFIKKGKIITV